jgi:hypothetical protein
MNKKRYCKNMVILLKNKKKKAKILLKLEGGEKE